MGAQQRASELFLACCEMSAADRAAFLEESCGEDRGLLREVEGMLAFDESRPDFLAGKAADAFHADEGELPRSIGKFRIRGKLGEGGMGTVYEAEQEAPHRTVALKILRPAFFSADALRRFEHEGEFLGRLQHPGVAQVFEVGRADAGSGPLPYMAMELVRGVPLTDYARSHDLSVRERLELVASVADAVQHAHENSVIHRDLKPANILVDGSGHPKVLDFGIARASGADVQLTTLETNVGHILGTLAYMSPEQASGDPAAIDTRADVYALGVVLYELLAGGLPYDVSSKSLPEAVRVIQEEHPQRLSAVRSLYRGDVATIVGKALEKERSRRYASAAALAEDLRRYLHDEPITARPPSRMYVLRKFVRRNRALTVAGGVVVLSLAVGFFVSTGLLIETKAALSEAHWGAYRGNVLAAATELQQGNYPAARRHLDQCRAEHRGWEWHQAGLALDSWLQQFVGHEHPVHALDISRDGTHLVTASKREVMLWDAKSGAWIDRLTVEDSVEGITSIDVGPGGRTVVFYRAGGVYVWDPESTSASLALSESGMTDVGVVRLGPDATWFAVGSRDGMLRIGDLESGEVRRLPGHTKGQIRGLAVSPDGERIASGSEKDTVVLLWDVATGRKLRRIEEGVLAGIKCLAFSPDGLLLAAGDKAPSIKIWEVDTGVELATLPCPDGTYVTSVAFDRDGSRIVSGHWNGVVRTWDIRSGSNLWIHRGHSRTWSTGVSVAAHPDGRRFLTSGYESTPRLWSFEAEGASTIVTDSRNAALRPHDLMFTSDGTRIIAQAGEIRVWSARDGEPLGSFEGSGAALSPDGERMAMCPGRIVDLATGEELVRLPVSAGSLAFSPDGRWLVAGDPEEALLYVLDAATGELVHKLEGGGGPPRLLCVGPGGTAISASGQIIDLWDLENGHRESLTDHEETVLDLTVIPGGRLFASCSKEGSIRVWDSATGRCVREFLEQQPGVQSISVSPDGRRMVSGSLNGRVRIWNLERADLLATLMFGSDKDRGFYRQTAASVAFSPDGKRLLTSRTGTLRIWESERETARTWWEGGH